MKRINNDILSRLLFPIVLTILLLLTTTTLAQNDTVVIVTYTLLPNELTEQETQVWSLGYNPSDSTQLASGSEFTAVHLWNVSSALRNNSGVPVLSDVLEESFFNEVIYDMVFYNVDDGQSSSSSSYLAMGFSSCSTPGTVQIWDISNGGGGGGVLLTSFVTHDLTVWALTISNDGRTLATASQDWTIRLWDINSILVQGNDPQISVVTLIGHEGAVFDIAYNPIGTEFVSGSIDGTVRIWGNPTGAPEGNFQSNLQTLNHGGVVRAVAYSPDGSIIVSAGDDGIIRVWNTTGYNLLTTMGPTQDSSTIIFALSFEQTNSYPHLASISDNVITIWNYKLYERVETFPVNGGRSIQYSPDGTQLAAGGFGRIQLWNINSDNSTSFSSEQPSATPSSNTTTNMPGSGNNETSSSEYPSVAPLDLSTMMPSGIGDDTSPPSSLQPSTNPTSNNNNTVEPNNNSSSAAPSSFPSDTPSMVPSTSGEDVLSSSFPSDSPSLIPSSTSSGEESPSSSIPSDVPSLIPTLTSSAPILTTSSPSVTTTTLITAPIQDATDTPSSGQIPTPSTRRPTLAPFSPKPTDNIFFQNPLPSATSASPTGIVIDNDNNSTNDEETPNTSTALSSSRYYQFVSKGIMQCNSMALMLVFSLVLINNAL